LIEETKCSYFQKDMGFFIIHLFISMIMSRFDNITLSVYRRISYDAAAIVMLSLPMPLR